VRVLLALLLVGIVGCGGSSPPGGGAVPTPEGSEAKVDKSPVRAAVEQKAAAKKSVEGRETLTLTEHRDGVWSVSFSPDGKRIVSGSLDETVKVWDAQTGQEMLTLTGHSAFVRSVSFSPDGKRIVSGSHDKTLKVWDAQTGQETLTLKGHSTFVTSVSFSPDGKRIVSGSGEYRRPGKIKVWDISSLDTSK
jgi:WD40 repeat protein